jgi:lipopolysaccharide/colanic/teichoic acid biosynthesis glycosyltransferase
MNDVSFQLTAAAARSSGGIDAVAECLASQSGAQPGESEARNRQDPVSRSGGGLKRALDIAVASLGLVVLAIPMAVIALAIKLDSRGPVLFRQVRIGRFGRPFRILKFRTMVDGHAPNAGITVSPDDQVTRVGRWLRASKANELPQLINVLRGEMSIVGPRPEVPAFVEKYSDEDKRVVLAVAPGMTDIASIVYIRETELLAAQENPLWYYERVVMPAKLAYYRFYARRAGVRLDLYVIWLTALAVVKQLRGKRPRDGAIRREKLRRRSWQSRAVAQPTERAPDQVGEATSLAA